MSVSIEGLMEKLGPGREKLCNWDTHGVAEFPVRALRQGLGGVVAQEDAEDRELGGAHGLVRGRSAKPPPTEWRAIRNAIMGAAIWRPLPPPWE